MQETIHHITPEERKVQLVARELQQGALLLYPSDTGMALACALSQKKTIEKLRRTLELPDRKGLTFLCESLSHISDYASVSNKAYKAMKHLIPGPFTFILPMNKKVPQLVLEPKKKTSGIRVPKNVLCTALLHHLGEPLLTATAKVHDSSDTHRPAEIIDIFGKRADVVLSQNEYHFAGESTVIDMTTDEFSILREGAELERAMRFL